MFGSSRQRTSAIDDAVEAFESARGQGGRAELEAFLPAPDHPLYLAVLCELVRVDLEYDYEENRTSRLENYERRFPELFRDPERAREVAFEEFRLRKEAGESPSPSEYRDRYGVDDPDWPATTPGSEPTVEKSPPASTDPSDRPLRGTDAVATSWRPSRRARRLRSRTSGAGETTQRGAEPADARHREAPAADRGRDPRRGLRGDHRGPGDGNDREATRGRASRGEGRLDRLTTQLGEAEFLLSLPDAPARKIDDGIALCRRAADSFVPGPTRDGWPGRPRRRSSRRIASGSAGRWASSWACGHARSPGGRRCPRTAARSGSRRRNG